MTSPYKRKKPSGNKGALHGDQCAICRPPERDDRLRSRAVEKRRADLDIEEQLEETIEGD